MKKNIILGASSIVAVLALASSAYATSDELRYSINGGAWVTVTDNGAGDSLNSIDNSISVTLTTGPFLGTISTGRNLGTQGDPELDLDLNITGTGTIVVEYSDINFQPIPSGSYILHGGNGSTTGVNDLYAFVGANSLYAGTDPTSPSSPFPPTVSPGGVLGPIVNAGADVMGAFPTQPNPYSLTIADSFTSPNSGRSLGFLSDDTHLSVPDGGSTLLMLGSAMSLLGLGMFRKNRKALKA